MQFPLLKEIRLKNLLSFGPDSEPLLLRPLNVLIGANGSGKSNLIEAISLLKSSPGEIASTISDGGGIADWLWKGAKHRVAEIEVVVTDLKSARGIRHWLHFTENARRFELVEERIEGENAQPGTPGPFLFFGWDNGRPVLSVQGGAKRQLKSEDVNPEKSILAQRKDPDQYPEITRLGREYERIRLYREWSFGRYTPPRLPQKDTGSSQFLEDDCANLGMVLNNLMGEPEVKDVILERLRDLYDGIDDIHVEIVSGHVQVVLHEGKMKIPATRLSDGTLRYLCILAILCHPSPPPLICIEEPELGLHPDALVAVSTLLKDSSQRTQLIVTTHSQVIVDALSASPEDVVVCSKENGQTQMEAIGCRRVKGLAFQILPW